MWVVAYLKFVIIFLRIFIYFFNFILRNFLVRTLQYFQTNFKFLAPTKSWKNHPQKLLRKNQIHLFSLLPWAAQTEEFMFQNVAYRPTVYKTGPIAFLFFAYL